MRTNALVLVSLGVVAAMGSVAHAGYHTDTPAYSYAYAPTRHATLSECDDCVATVNLPWAMPYFGRTFSQVTISTNGWIRLGSYTGSAYFSNPTLTWNGTTSAPGPVIAPLWDDWNPSAGGDVWYGQVGGAFVVEWWNVMHYGQVGGSTYSFQAKLFPDGRIEFHYANMTGGGAEWDSGRSATVGLQEDSHTIAQPVSNNAPAIASYSARGFTRPGPVMLYLNVTDGFFTPPRPRANLEFRQTFKCGSTTYNLSATTANAEWSWAWSGPCGSPSLVGDPVFVRDTMGHDVATIPMSPISIVTNGTYRFVRRSDFTPSPTIPVRMSVSYNGEATTYTSKLDYWRPTASVDRPVLIVTGFDPLNESSTAEYLVLMGDLARAALAEGRTVAIGKFGDGNRRISWFHDEVGRWADDVYVRNGYRPLQVAGVSMGGVVTRGAIDWNSRGIRSKVSAWYSVDAPQRGANLGRAYRGIQTMLRCHKSSTDPQRRMIESSSAADMMTIRAATCSCDDEPENSTCQGTTQYHDEHYGMIGWPTVLPRYAVAFGDANPAGGYAKMGSGTLYDFSYTGWFCSEDRDWNGGQRDCNAGSRYMTASMVNTDEGASLCGTFKLRLKYEPAFINADSALGLSTGLASNTEDASCSSSYPTLSPTYWNGWTSNNHNEHHTVLTAALRDQLIAWIRNHAP